MIRLLSRLRHWKARRRFDRELAEEIETHRSLRQAHLEASGLSADDAGAASGRALGNLTLAVEEARDVWAWTRLNDFTRDLRIAGRSLRRTPGFTITAVSSLALGVALVAATIACVNAYLIRALPYPDAERLYRVRYAPPGQLEPRGLSALDWTALSEVVDVADSSQRVRFTLTDGPYRREAPGLAVAHGSLDALGVGTVEGRAFLEDEFRAGSERVALIGHALWRERFGSDPAIVGRYFQATSGNQEQSPETYRIVGILRPEFRYVREYAAGAMEIVVPLRTAARVYMVRLRDGVSPANAEERITTAARALEPTLPPEWRIQMASLQAEYSADIQPMLVAMTAAAGLVLLIVSANVAILVLLRTLRRQREMAVRLALGAARRHIVRFLIAEACIMTAVAFAAGLVLTVVSLRALAPVIEEQLGRDVPGGPSALSVDPTVVLIVGGVGLMVALSLAFIPLLAPWQRQVGDTIRRDGRGTDGRSMQWARAALISLEVAGSVALLVGCGLMIRSVVNLVGTDLGYRTEGIARSRITLPSRTYASEHAMAGFYESLADRLTAVSSSPIALANFPPLVAPQPQPFESDAAADAQITAGVLAASGGYFTTLGLELRQGRLFTAADRLGSGPVAIVSDALARRLWPGQSAVGHRIRTVASPVAGAPLTDWRTIVGVTSDVRQTWTDTDLYDIYIPFFQAPTLYGQLFLPLDRPAPSTLETLRALVSSIDDEVMIPGLIVVEETVGEQLAGARFLTSVMTGFAAFAALLALLGIYGVTAYAVRQRESEIAIRMALGATGRAVVLMFVRRACLVLGAGLVAGTFAARLVARLLEHQLHGVPAFDPLTLAIACLVMGMGSMLATWWPARRATARNPIAALKES